MFKGFKQFILRGNVIDLAVGVIMGAAFGGVVNALVKDILTPLLAAIVRTPDFSTLAFTVNESKFMYGDFLNVLISFVLTSTAVYFFIVAPLNVIATRTKKEEIMQPTTKKCPECLSSVPIEATRCAFCTTKFS